MVVGIVQLVGWAAGTPKKGSDNRFDEFSTFFFERGLVYICFLGHDHVFVKNTYFFVFCFFVV